MTRFGQNRMVSLSVLLLLWMVAAPSVSAFFATKAPAAANKVSSASTEQAIEIYNQNFPFDRPPPKGNPLGDFGMPNQDFDGTRLKAKNPSKKRLTDITRAQAKQAFELLAKLYGEERALGMVKAQPLCLAFDVKNFDPSLQAWTEVFGLEAAQDMVARNPGLLAVRPEEAAQATDSTMAFSYIVAATRPLGAILMATLLLLLLTPTLESLTGIQYGINH